MSDTAMIDAVSVESMTTLLQSAGYRVTPSEQGDVVQLLSASQGIGFALRFGNRRNDTEYLDYTLSCALRVQGELPPALVNDWNRQKRFARLSHQAGFLLLEQDVIVAGGVSEGCLRANAEIWDRLLQEFILFLKQYIAQPVEAAAPMDVDETETA
ncbi:hypothetical protein S7S_18150 [Isoalcanivorax pacificus W11-5]|uniref:Sensory transduction regulator n=1 Tax=Isoalcanivorax pacificus W11-5 TaxID=391936 RepID=A0A0B4XUW1_9GAMM|nr:YbjN domain-containing protein [Isoalcanivorax pacificus]AJD50042.1 hypothetical protein S7S_18150 [Isoalcanivorax pacificus W11-5]